MKKFGTPPPSSSAAAKRMRATRQTDTAPELALRKQLHALGLRYRTNQALLPGMRRRADIVFSSARVAVFVDGCFWHCCPKHRSFPKANRAWWAKKLKANRERDRNTDRALRDAGWLVERIWEHEDPIKAAHRVLKCLEWARGC